jgi:hypothetical protein
VTAPSGRSYLVYKRCRLEEARLLIEAQHLVGIPTWHDINDLAREPLEAELKRILGDDATANAVLFLTPEVRDSEVIQRIECPAVFVRHSRRDAFFVVPTLAGGLDYAAADWLLDQRFGNKSLGLWNVERIGTDPISFADATHIAGVVLRERLSRIAASARADEPLRITFNTRARPPFRQSSALALDWSDLFDGRVPKERSAWASRLLPALDTVSRTIREVAPGRECIFGGLASIPATIALGYAFSLPTGTRASWLQHMSSTQTEDAWNLREFPQALEYSVDTEDGQVAAEDVAVLLSVSRSTRESFDRCRTHLPSFRCVVDVRPPAGTPRSLTALDSAVMARSAIAAVQAARDKYRPTGPVHLFASVPLGLAFMVGQLLNAVGPVQTYEYDPTGVTGRYEAAALLT